MQQNGPKRFPPWEAAFPGFAGSADFVAAVLRRTKAGSMFWHASRDADLAAFLRIWLYVVYPLIKLLAYVAWCRWGASFLDAKPGLSAWKEGAIRFVLGLAFGGAVSLAAVALGADALAWLYGRLGRTAVYVAVFTPLRWAEWWIMERFMAREQGPLFHPTRRTLFWRAGGILTSFASDAPLFLLVSFIGAIA